MEVVDICNNALDLVGQGVHIDSLEEQSKEADLCRRLYQQTVERALSKFNFSFARKDEVITKDNLLKDEVILQWKYAYSIPSDVQRILYLSPIDADSTNETTDPQQQIRFNFRNQNNKTVLVTDELAPFAMHYQSKVVDCSLFTVDFCEALEYMLASRIAPALIHGTTGLTHSNTLFQQGLLLLSMASGTDAQQGAESIQPITTTTFIKARGVY